MIFFFNNICEPFWGVPINIAKVERLLDYNNRHFLSKILLLFILPTKITHLFLAAVLALLDKTCQQFNVGNVLDQPCFVLIYYFEASQQMEYPPIFG